VVANGQIKANGSYKELEKLEFPLLMAADSLQHDKKENEDEIMNEAAKLPLNRFQTEVQSREKESQQKGKVSVEVYKKYFKAIQSLPLVIFVFVLRVIYQAVASFIDYFVAQWINWEESQIAEELLNGVCSNTTDDLMCTSSTDDERKQFVKTYIMIITASVVLIFITVFMFIHTLIRVSQNLHDLMLRGLTQAHMKFFMKNSSGRILNRFSKDIACIDTSLTNNIYECSNVSCLQISAFCSSLFRSSSLRLYQS
jgi:ABC-type multidrug transport system fused ATPase/permease subunit